MRSIWRNVVRIGVVVIALVVGLVLIYYLIGGSGQSSQSFAQIFAIMKPSCTDEQHLDIYMYVAAGDTQTRTFTVRNVRTGATTTSVSPVTEPNGGPKYYERITSKAPPGTIIGDPIMVTLQVSHKVSPPQTQEVSYICNTGQLVGYSSVRTTLVP